MTFRIKEDAAGRKRRELLLNIITLSTIGSEWDEPTSFIMFDTKQSFGKLAKDIENLIDTKEDVVLLSSLSGRPMVVIGQTDKMEVLRRLAPDVLPLSAP
jgi:hypothetical protein